MIGPAYREHAPRPTLAELVHCVWTFEGPADSSPQPIAPDGRPELIVHRGGPYREPGVYTNTLQAPALFAGQLTRPLAIMAQGAPSVIGVRFHAWAARAFLGRPADEATDRRLPLFSLHGEAAARLIATARGAPSLDAARVLVEDYVDARLVGARIDEAVRAAIEALIGGADLAPPAGISERQWQRRFKAEVGVSARELQSILRFRRVFDAIERPEKPGWVEAALAAGYFDQPQMARDFRRFLGRTARDWAAQQVGLAKALAAPGASESYKNVDGVRE